MASSNACFSIMVQGSRKHYCTNASIRGKDTIDEEWYSFLCHNPLYFPFSKEGFCLGV